MTQFTQEVLNWNVKGAKTMHAAAKAAHEAGGDDKTLALVDLYDALSERRKGKKRDNFMAQTMEALKGRVLCETEKVYVGDVVLAEKTEYVPFTGDVTTLEVVVVEGQSRHTGKVSGVAMGQPKDNFSSLYNQEVTKVGLLVPSPLRRLSDLRDHKGFATHAMNYPESDQGMMFKVYDAFMVRLEENGLDHPLDATMYDLEVQDYLQWLDAAMPEVAPTRLRQLFFSLFELDVVERREGDYKVPDLCPVWHMFSDPEDFVQTC